MFRARRSGLVGALAVASWVPFGVADPLQMDSLHADLRVGSIMGSVFDYRGRPMDFTDISILGTGLRATVHQGRFRIEAVPIGHHRIQARFIGHEPQTLDVHVRRNQVTRVTFRLDLWRGGAEPTVHVDAQGNVRVNGALVVKKTCPDSVVVIFQLLHDEVQADKDLECRVRIENVSTHRIRVPKDLRPFISASYIYANGNRDDFNSWWEMTEKSLGPTKSLGPRRSTETLLNFPGRGMPGRYTFQLTLWRPTRAWLWHEPAWIQHNCHTFESDRWTVTVRP